MSSWRLVICFTAFVLAGQTFPCVPTDVARLIDNLGSSSIELREESSDRLVKRGAAALGPLEEARMHPDPEVAIRARQAYAQILSELTQKEVNSLPFEKLIRDPVNLHTLSMSLQRFSPKPLIWTHDGPVLNLVEIEGRGVSSCEATNCFTNRPLTRPAFGGIRHVGSYRSRS